MTRHFTVTRRLAAAALALLLLTAATPARAELRLGSIFVDHAVLQREVQVPVWGWDEPGTQVTVRFAGQSATAKADDSGAWSAMLDPMEATGRGQMLTVETDASSQKLTVNNVVVGDVWLCSGQSNMEWGLKGSARGPEVIRTINDPLLRSFNVDHAIAGEPQATLNGSWRMAKGDAAAGFSAVGFYFGQEIRREVDVPVGLIKSAWGGTRIQPWLPLEAFAAQDKLNDQHKQLDAQVKRYRTQLTQALPDVERWVTRARAAVESGAPVPAPPAMPAHPLAANQQSPTTLYNAMIHPFIKFPIKGVLWYQGESNMGEHDLYDDHLRALMQGWRDAFGQDDLPFGIVLLAPYSYGNQPGRLPLMWEAQARAVADDDHAGIAVTTDIGDPNDIHPRNKTDVGKRLARWALAAVYGHDDVIHQGPAATGMTIDDHRIRVKFDHTAQGLSTPDDQPPTHFEVAGSDGRYMPATATIVGDEMIVTSDAVVSPTSVRFAWDNTAQPNLFNSEGLPAMPFRLEEK